MKNKLSVFKPLILFIFVFTLTNVSSRIKNDVYKRYNCSNYKTIQGADREIDFENIDYKLLNALIFFRTNEERIKKRLAPLEYLENLEISATMHANDMVKFDFFDHYNTFNISHKTPDNRLRLSGIKNPCVAENIAINFGIDYKGGKPIYLVDADKGLFSYSYPYIIIKNRTYFSLANELVVQWMNSPGHRANILSTHGLQLGCGTAFFRDKSFNNIATFYAVQNFQWYEKADAVN